MFIRFFKLCCVYTCLILEIIPADAEESAASSSLSRADRTHAIKAVKDMAATLKAAIKR